MLRRFAALRYQSLPFAFHFELGQQLLPNRIAALLIVALAAFQSQAQQLPVSPAQPICSAPAANAAAISVCTLNVQAGIPYSGKIAEYRVCPEEKDLRFTAFWDSTSSRAEVSDDGLHHGSLLGTHTWMSPGEYQARIEAASRNRSSDPHARVRPDSDPACPSRGSSASGLVHVFVPVPPISMFISARKLRPGRSSANAGAVALRQPAPPSGMLLTLETSKPGEVDVQTQFGRTGPASRKTYLWVEPGRNTRSFDLIIDPRVPEGFEAEIKSDCAGAIVAKSECDAASTGISSSKTFPVRIRDNFDK